MARLGFTGVTPIDTRVAALTVSVVEPDTLASAAVIVVEPGLTALPSPLEPALLLTDATPVAEELQVTEVVRSWVELSVYTPVALNTCSRPLAILGVVGVTPIDTRVAAVTVSAVEPDTLPRVAMIVVEPELSVVASPMLADALLMDATLALEELQVTVEETSCFEPSL